MDSQDPDRKSRATLQFPPKHFPITTLRPKE